MWKPVWVGDSCPSDKWSLSSIIVMLFWGCFQCLFPSETSLFLLSTPHHCEKSICLVTFPSEFHRLFWFRILFVQVYDVNFLLQSTSCHGGYSGVGGEWGWEWLGILYLFSFFRSLLLSKVNPLGHNFIDALGPYFCLFSSQLNRLVSHLLTVFSRAGFPETWGCGLYWNVLL